jgi:hypothetical protein
MKEADDLLLCARTARAVLARVTASGDDARMRRWRYRQLITHHHDHRQLTDVEFKEQAAQELAMLDYLWKSGATAGDYDQFENRTGIAMNPRLTADVLHGLREARALMDGLRPEAPTHADSAAGWAALLSKRMLACLQSVDVPNVYWENTRVLGGLQPAETPALNAPFG